MEEKKYKVIDGISFHVGTPDEVCNILLQYLKHYPHERLRLFYGDNESGKDWLEMHDTMGYVRNSTGPVKIPILIHNRNSIGGGAILTDCIVKITHDKNVLYQHPKYHCPIEKRGYEIWDTDKNECVYRAREGHMYDATIMFNFLIGKRNRYGKH